MVSKKILGSLVGLALAGSLAHAVDPTPTPDEMYWEGAGDTPPMSSYEQGGGYLRFTEFPVRVYLNLSADARWEVALDDALDELSDLLPIVRTSKPAQADIFIEVLEKSRFDDLAPCDTQHQDACSLMRPIGQPDTPTFDLISRVWVHAAPTLPREHLLRHELIHALGLLVHSPYPEDVMYNGADAAPLRLSQRDRATLLYLYRQPPIE